MRRTVNCCILVWIIFINWFEFLSELIFFIELLQEIILQIIVSYGNNTWNRKNKLFFNSTFFRDENSKLQSFCSTHKAKYSTHWNMQKHFLIRKLQDSENVFPIDSSDNMTRMRQTQFYKNFMIKKIYFGMTYDENTQNKLYYTLFL